MRQWVIRTPEYILYTENICAEFQHWVGAGACNARWGLKRGAGSTCWICICSISAVSLSSCSAFVSTRTCDPTPTCCAMLLSALAASQQELS